MYLAALVGALLIGIGVYTTFNSAPNQPGFIGGLTAKSISIPFQNFTRPAWNEYNPGYDGKTFQEAANIWMRAKGEITYLANLPEQPQGGGSVTVRMCSEIRGYGNYGHGVKDSSDTVLTVNGYRLDMKNVVADDGVGRDYSWDVPKGVLREGVNELTLKVGEGTYSNGLTIFSPIKVAF